MALKALPRWPEVPKADALGGDGGVGVEGVVGGDEAGDVDQVGGEGQVAGLVGCLGLDWCSCRCCPLGLLSIFVNYMGCGLRREWVGWRWIGREVADERCLCFEGG